MNSLCKKDITVHPIIIDPQLAISVNWGWVEGWGGGGEDVMRSAVHGLQENSLQTNL